MACTSRPSVRVLAALAGCAVTATASQAEVRPAGEPTAVVYTSVEPGGEASFALALRAERLPEVAVAGRDHVLLVDTSASQVGAHRQQALAVLDALLESLPAADRVFLYAVDLKNIELTREFVAPGSGAARTAVAELHRRFPAGATHLPSAIQAALAKIDGGRPASIVYLGDGMSMAHVVQPAELNELIAELQSRQVPVHCYAVGPQTDAQLLGSLAAQTGGVVLFDRGGDDSDAPATVGQELAAAIVAPVFYPEQITVEPAGLTLRPAKALPVRADRATVYLGRGTLAGDVKASVSGEFAGQPVSLSWTVSTDDFRSGRTFLTALYDKAERTGSASVGFAGTPMLHLAQEEFNDAVDRGLVQAERALAANEPRLAEAIALGIKKADPHNVQVDALLSAAVKRDKRLSVRTVAQVQPAGPAGPADAPAEAAPAEQPAEEAAPALPAIPPAADQPAPADDLPAGQLLDRFPGVQPPAGRSDVTGRNLITDEQLRRRIVTEQTEREIAAHINDSRRLALTDPQTALGEVKRRLDHLQRMTDLIPEVQRQLVRRLEDLMVEIRNQLELQEQNERLAAERRSQIEAEARLIAESAQREQDLEMLLDRVRALMEEGRHGTPGAFLRARQVSSRAVSVAPESGAAAAALFNAEAAAQLERAAHLRALRSEKFLETLHQVELSHVPFPDEPPVVWPSAEFWQQITQRRKKWASVSLESTSPQELRIREALVDPQGVDISFVDQPLKEAMEYLAEAHGITIILDEKALQDEGVQTDEPLNHLLSGITLRSALRIMLEPLGLTYIIEDEVMKITTQVAADEALSTRVYPVGDLVIPIPPPQQAGIGQGQGGGGGFGQGGGGQGGFGGGGQGGFGGGGGGQGGGGGFFSVPAEKQPAFGVARPAQPAPRPAPAADAEVEQILRGILGDATSRVDGPFGRGLAQIRDPQPGRPFRLDNETVDSLKKKPLTVR